MTALVLLVLSQAIAPAGSLVIPDPLARNSVNVERLDAGVVAAGEGLFDTVRANVVDAGQAWVGVLRNPDGGTVYAPAGVAVDAASPVCFNGPAGCSSRIFHNPANRLVLQGQAGTTNIDGFVAQGTVEAGELQANSVELVGGATSATVRAASGTGATPDAGLYLLPGAPNGPLVVPYASGVWTPRVQTVDGETLGFGGYGWQMEPVPYVVPCDLTRRGTVIRWLGTYGYEQWECTEGSLASCDGCWGAPHNEVLTFSAYTPADVGGVANSSGVIFASEDPGTHPVAIGGFRLQVVEEGTGPGEVAKGRIFQRNAADGGQIDLLTFALPCEAPVGTCVYYSDIYPGQPASSGCAYEGTRVNLSLDFPTGGAIDFEFQPDGGQCAANPRAWGTGYVKRIMYADGGGG